VVVFQARSEEETGHPVDDERRRLKRNHMSPAGLRQQRPIRRSLKITRMALSDANERPLTALRVLPGPHELSREITDMRNLFAGLIAILVAVGIQMVHSASLTSGPSQAEKLFLGRHLTWLLLASLTAFLASRVSPAKLQRSAPLLFRGLVILLILVLIPGIGARLNGAQRWLRFAGLSMQPSEFGRLVLPILAATQVIRLRAAGTFSMRSLPRLLLPLVIVLPLVAREPDLGATVFLAVGYLLTLFLGGWPLRCFFTILIPAVPITASVLILKPYQIKRITGFLAAWQDLSQAPWQMRQSLLSLGSGGLMGTGIGAGWQKLSYLPEANTDFVFAVIGEELGLAGTLTICLLWMAVFLTGRSLVRSLPPSSFQWILANTLLFQLIFQAMANIAVVTAMVPPKGVPHPFISYGGTNLLVSLTAVGLIIGMSRHTGGHDDEQIDERVNASSVDPDPPPAQPAPPAPNSSD
jgi:cell division protein FtsW